MRERSQRSAGERAEAAALHHDAANVLNTRTLAEALERDGRFLASPNGDGTAAALRLETEIVLLQQEFAAPPSAVRFRLDARLVDLCSRRVLAASAFEAVEAAPTEDPYGGAIAANRAVARVFDEVAAWCGRNAPAADRAAATPPPIPPGLTRSGRASRLVSSHRIHPN